MRFRKARRNSSNCSTSNNKMLKKIPTLFPSTHYSPYHYPHRNEPPVSQNLGRTTDSLSDAIHQRLTSSLLPCTTMYIAQQMWQVCDVLISPVISCHPSYHRLRRRSPSTSGTWTLSLQHRPTHVTVSSTPTIVCGRRVLYIFQHKFLLQFKIKARIIRNNKSNFSSHVHQQHLTTSFLFCPSKSRLDDKTLTVGCGVGRGPLQLLTSLLCSYYSCCTDLNMELGLSEASCLLQRQVLCSKTRLWTK